VKVLSFSRLFDSYRTDRADLMTAVAPDAHRRVNFDAERVFNPDDRVGRTDFEAGEAGDALVLTDNRSWIRVGLRGQQPLDLGEQKRSEASGSAFCYQFKTLVMVLIG
jgi:hypothetical protein